MVASTIIPTKINAQNIDTLSVNGNYIDKAKGLSSTTDVSYKDTVVSNAKNINGLIYKTSSSKEFIFPKFIY